MKREHQGNDLQHDRRFQRGTAGAGVRSAVKREDDAFCQKMLDDYRSDADPHKHDSVTLDEFAKELGINLDEL